MQVFRILRESIKDCWEELFSLVLLNLLTVLLALPVITLPPALAGLWSIANLVAKGDDFDWRDYFDGFRRHFWKAWKLALLNILVGIIVSTNVYFYTPGITPFELDPRLSTWIRGFFLAVAFVWSVLQLYLFFIMPSLARIFYS